MHGDDYVSCGTPEDLKWLESKMKEQYEIKVQRVGTGDGKLSEGKILNRILRKTTTGWELEEILGMGNSLSRIC